ncbi:MAG: HAMP domain-containing protein [Betaproteobacteria bacterium]|nr:HAMP domain-containing protein [Betaproteobacteria bacterium]MSQ89406.1 HAMP domain-containing protein [Betaproteobacteria bacterium]
MRLLILLGAALACVLLFLLATASANTTAFANHYPLLLGLNAALAALLAVLVAWQMRTLWRKYRQRVFGSRLTVRLLLLLALMAVVPGALVYTVSVQFLSKSIESWFNVKVDAALEGGINLGQSAIDQMLSELNAKARAIATELTDRPANQQVLLLDRLRHQSGVQEAVIVNGSGRVLASSSEDISRLVPELPTPQALRQARTSRGYTSVDAAAGKPLALRVVVPVVSLALTDETRFVQLRQSVPEQFGRSAEAVEAAYRDYRELVLARQGLKRIYIVTLTLALSMALLVAIALAAVLASQLSEPLANLAQATQAIARGDFSRQAPVTSQDELGVLIESFNSMTRQLDDAQRVVEANRMALESAKARLENILANLSAGVLVFDHALGLSISNHGALAILGAELESFAAEMREQFRAHGALAWQLEVKLKSAGKALLVRGTALPQDPAGGYVLVFDDITQLIQAQRATAWAEVARRLAHEIKNPLTPIQLSAERMEMKLSGKLSPEDAEVLTRGTQTIVKQVAALKSMVDDFRDYSRLPAPVFAALELNDLVLEVLALYETSNTPIARELAPTLPQVRADSAQIRQVLHNLVQNAQEALELRKGGGEPPRIEVRTEAAADKVRLSVTDNGGGFPEEMMARIFEPYVTSKPRGTGLGLAIVKKIVDEHHGELAIENRLAQGVSVSILLPVAAAADRVGNTLAALGNTAQTA